MFATRRGIVVLAFPALLLIGCRHDLLDAGRPCNSEIHCKAGQACVENKCVTRQDKGMLDVILADLRADKPASQEAGLDATGADLQDVGSPDIPLVDQDIDVLAPPEQGTDALPLDQTVLPTGVKLLHGSFGLTGPVAGSSVQLLEGSFGVTSTVCNSIHCVSGGIVP